MRNYNRTQETITQDQFIQEIANEVAAKNIESGFVKDIAIMSAVNRRGRDPISMVGSFLVEEIQKKLEEMGE